MTHAACTGALGALNGTNGQLLPFTLGQAFLFTDDISLSAIGYQRNIDTVSESGTGSLNFSFILTEANGTPVQVFAAPEPSTFALLLLSALIVAGVRFNRVKLIRQGV